MTVTRRGDMSYLQEGGGGALAAGQHGGDVPGGGRDRGQGVSSCGGGRGGKKQPTALGVAGSGQQDRGVTSSPRVLRRVRPGLWVLRGSWELWSDNIAAALPQAFIPGQCTGRETEAAMPGGMQPGWGGSCAWGVPGGARWVCASTVLLHRVILESNPQQVIQRLSLQVNAATLSHDLPHFPLPLPRSPASLPPADPRASTVRLRPLRLPGRLGAQGHRGRWWPQIGSTEEARTPRANFSREKLSTNEGEGSQVLLTPSRNRLQIKFSSLVWCRVSVRCARVGGSPCTRHAPRLRSGGSWVHFPWRQSDSYGFFC